MLLKSGSGSKACKCARQAYLRSCGLDPKRSCAFAQSSRRPCCCSLRSRRRRRREGDASLVVPTLFQLCFTLFRLCFTFAQYPCGDVEHGRQSHIKGGRLCSFLLHFIIQEIKRNTLVFLMASIPHILGSDDRAFVSTKTWSWYDVKAKQASQTT